MENIIVQGIIIVLCAIGVTEIIRSVILWLLRIKTKGDYCYIVLPLDKTCTDAENRIRAAAAQIKWSDSGGAQTIICLDCGMDEETRAVCEKTAADYDMIAILTREEFESAKLI